MVEAAVVNERKMFDTLFSGADIKVSCPACGHLLYKTSPHDHVDELKCPACKRVSRHRIYQGNLISRTQVIDPLANPAVS
jgi:phage FluMu protein Com